MIGKKITYSIFLFFFLYLIFSTANLYAVDVETVCYTDKIIIRINNLKTHFEKENDTNQIQLKIDNSNNIYQNTGKINFDELYFNLAIQQISSANIKFSQKKFISIGRLKENDLNNFKEINLNVSAELVYTGILRGVPIASINIQPFEFDYKSMEIKAIQSAEIIIHLPELLQVSEPQLNETEKGFFASIINKQHLNYFLQQRFSNKTNNDITLSSDNWYSPDKTYLKITTTKDGIAYIDGSDSTLKNSLLFGKQTKFIHLFYKGIEQPIFLMNDSDGILDESDRIYFIGMRPIGDTTWFNVFSNENVFYLVYDESKPGSRIEKFQDTGPSLEPVDKVRVNNHIEYDKYCSFGYIDNQITTETVNGEGWFWDFISPIPNNAYTNAFEKETFTYSTLLNSDLNSSDSIRINFYIKSNDYITENNTPYHIIKSVINKDTIATYQIPHRKGDTISIIYPQSQLNTGINKLMLKSFYTYDQFNVLQNPDDVWLDYISIEGTVAPFAFKGKSDFEVPNINFDSEIKVKGFNSDNIFVIDTSKKIIQFPQSERGSWIRATSINGKYPASSFILNDSVLYDSTGQGLHVAILRYPSYKAEFKLFRIFNTEIDDYLQNIPDSSIICIANNSDEFLQHSTRNIIQNLGSKEIMIRVAGQSWIFLVRKGNLNSVIEKRNTSGTVQLDEFIKHNDGNSYIGKIKLPGGSKYHLICRDESSIEHASIFNVEPSHLRDSSQQADLIIITHKNFKLTSDSLAHYREKTHNLKAMVVDVEDIYKEFNYGIKSPHAIKNFLKNAYFNWRKPAPAYLTIIGDACWDNRKITNGVKYDDYVPSYGWPASDYWYTLLDGNDLFNEMIVGRIPIRNEEMGFSYIDKLIEYDTIPIRPWIKNFLFLSGGGDDKERWDFASLIDDCSPIITLPYLCADTSSVKKRDKTTGGELEGPEIISKINNGAIWVSFLGHSAATVFDMDGWQVDKLNNKPKYSFLTTFGCNSGAYLEPNVICRNEEYLFAPNRGSICVAGPTSAGQVISDKLLMINMMSGLADTILKIRQIGDIINYGKNRLYHKGSDTTTIYQFSLLGDPLVKLKIKTQPDLYTIPNEIDVKNLDNETVITESDSVVIISGFIYNGGYCQYDTVEFRLIREFENNKDTIILFIPGICLNAQFNLVLPILNMAGKHKVTLEIDPDSLLTDADFSNNNTSFSFEVFSKGLVPLAPLPFWDMRATGPIFRVIDQACSDDIVYNFEIRDKKDLSTGPVYSSVVDEITDYATHIEWKPQLLRLLTNQPYWLVANKKSKTGLTESKVLWVPFSTTSSWDSGFVKHTQRGEEQLSAMTLDSLSVFTIDDTARISFETLLIPYYMHSIHGDGILARDVEIDLDGKVYIESPDDEPSQAPVGFNVVVASGIDGSYKMKRNFDTWGTAHPQDGERFVRFLKDTVDPKDYILIATCGASFRLFWDAQKFNPTSIGSFDSLRYYLRLYGSKLADSITTKTNYDPNSFVMVGRRGSPVGSIPEALNTQGKVAQISDTIKIKLRSGHFTTPDIGPAKQWKNLSFTGKLDTGITKSKIMVFGISYEKNDSVKLIENDTSVYVDLSDINAYEYPYLKVEAHLERSNDTSESYITSFTSCFNPLPELAFFKDNCTIQTDSVMRGDSASQQFVVRNLSERINSEKSSMNVTIYSENNLQANYQQDIPELGINGQSSIDMTFDTESLGVKNNIIATLYSPIRDIYTFNNYEFRNFNLIEDRIKPTIELRLDGKLVQNGDYVSINPTVEVTLFDNSVLPVKEGDIKVRINATVQIKKPNNNWTDTIYGKERPRKAKLSFTSDSLDFGENIFIVMFSDATGNRDTSRVSVFVSLNGFIENIKNYPNPFENSTTFQFYYKAPHQGAIALVTVYNVSGVRVASFRKELYIGENKFDWEARDENGSVLPIGMYFYKINIESDFYVDPIFGKFVIMR